MVTQIDTYGHTNRHTWSQKLSQKLSTHVFTHSHSHQPTHLRQDEVLEVALVAQLHDKVGDPVVAAGHDTAEGRVPGRLPACAGGS